MTDSRKTGLLRLRHLMETTEAVSERMTEQRERFTALARDSARPTVVSAAQLFQTPEPLAARLAGMFAKFGRVLEPSAGLGRLYRAVRAVDATCPITLVDISTDCCRELYRASEGDSGTTLITADFLTLTPDRLGRFDSIIMNPPFKMGTDVKHIRHAMQFLNPGGRLITICANGPKQRAAIKPLAGEWIELPAGSFKSEGTDVAAAIAVIDT